MCLDSRSNFESLKFGTNIQPNLLLDWGCESKKTVCFDFNLFVTLFNRKLFIYLFIYWNFRFYFNFFFSPILSNLGIMVVKKFEFRLFHFVLFINATSIQNNLWECQPFGLPFKYFTSTFLQILKFGFWRWPIPKRNQHSFRSFRHSFHSKNSTQLGNQIWGRFKDWHDATEEIVVRSSS